MVALLFQQIHALRAGVVTYFFRHELKLKQRTAESVVNTTNIIVTCYVARKSSIQRQFVSATTYISDGCAIVLYQLQELLVIVPYSRNKCKILLWGR